MKKRQLIAALDEMKMPAGAILDYLDTATTDEYSIEGFLSWKRDADDEFYNQVKWDTQCQKTIDGSGYGAMINRIH